jgi:hypothetical protein
MVAAQQFQVDPGKLVESLQQLTVGLNRLTSLGELRVGFKQQAAHTTFGEASIEIKEGAMLFALMAGALGPSAGQEPFQQRGVNKVGRQLEGTQEAGFALAQSQGGKAPNLALTTHIYT